MTAAPAPSPAPEPAQPRVPVWAPFVVLAIVFVVIGIFGAAAVAVLASADPSISVTNPPDWVTIALTTIQDAGFVFAAWIAVRLSGRRADPDDFGLRLVPVRRAVLWMAAVYIAFWIAAAALLLIFGEPPDQDIVSELKKQDSFAVLAGYAVLTCMFAPFAEEFFFRGFMFTTLRPRIGAVWASLVVGAVFGLVHAPGAPLLGVAVLAVFGIALCVLYVRTGSIIPCMALHAIHNSISFATTKSLPAWGLLGLMAVSVGAVVAVGGGVARSASRAVTG
jgi:membrane protease YdiL (CAAX protease family)